MIKSVKKSRPLSGEMTIDADKSVSHRAVLFSALANGEAEIKNFLIAEDTLSTLACVQRLGVNARREGDRPILRPVKHSSRAMPWPTIP